MQLTDNYKTFGINSEIIFFSVKQCLYHIILHFIIIGIEILHVQIQIFSSFIYETFVVDSSSRYIL